MSELNDHIQVRRQLQQALDGRIPADQISSVLQCAERLVASPQGDLALECIDRTITLIVRVRQHEADRSRSLILAEQKRILHAQLDKAQTLLTRLHQSIESVRSIVYQPPPSLDDADMELAEGWARSLGGTDYWRSAMRSARRAERAALSVYRQLSNRVHDLAIEQLRLDGDSRWCLADIEADGRLIDVKNARRSFSSPESYSEHCVPAFKLDRAGRDVAISGFLSPYVPEEQPKPTADKPIVWLGECRYSDLARTFAQFQSQHFKPRLETRREHQARHQPHLLPPWLFDYPPTAYQARDAALQMLLQEASAIDVDGVPLALRVLARSPSVLQADRRSSEAVQLLARIEAAGLSRAVVFLHVLDRFAESSVHHTPLDYDALAQSIFFEGSHPEAPLGMCDPLLTIRILLSTLRLVQRRTIPGEFRTYTLRSSGVLRGIRPNGTEQTIIAYCGGWIVRPDGQKRKCGRVPIFLGQDEPCPECGYLICSKCLWCCEKCSENSSRHSMRAV